MPKTIGFVLLLMITTGLYVFPTKANDELKTYIVHLDSHPQDQDYLISDVDLEKWYKSFLSKIASPSYQKPTIVYAYHHVILGFAAKMSEGQAKAMGNLSGVLDVWPEGVYQLHTTRSPDFLGLRQNPGGLWKHLNKGEGIIIGVIDSGITPGHPSFDDEGVPPPPPRWKGKCEIPGCNNKLIGMRSFVNGNSPKDDVGHGTHTSGTAAGNSVNNTNVFGQANGTASGMAPLAHLAMYRVCEGFGCSSIAILAGMEVAMEDGCDVLSVSLGGSSVPLYQNPIAVAGFSAIQKGILVSCSAGNSGPMGSTVSNDAPWLLTVGASTMDRRIRTSVLLGNDKLLDGESLYQPNGFNHKLRPLVYPGKDTDNGMAKYCIEGSLGGTDVKGKVVICDVGVIANVEKGQVVKDARGAAMVIVNNNITGESIAAEGHVIPASYVGYKEGVEIKKYMNSTSSPVATILLLGTVKGLKSDPEVAYFSSRGPSVASPGILKPDVIGPGVDVLAAWPESVDNNTSSGKATFNMIRGTSMSCPHLSGISALLKRAHSEWSPAAIKSAIMTTASQVDRKGDAIIDERDLPADVLAIGSGHVNPSKANKPGLVFDLHSNDYIPYLCGLGYTPKQVQIIVKKRVSCSKKILEGQLNYPSFTVSLKKGDRKTYSRTVTNVGKPNSTYTIRDTSLPLGVTIVNENSTKELRFKEMYEKVMYNVTFTRSDHDKERGPFGQGHMTWAYGKYAVRTPFLFKFE